MKDFDDFVNQIMANQNEIAEKSMVNANAFLKRSSIKMFPEELRIAVTGAVSASSLVSLETTLEILRRYHQWSNPSS